MRRFFLLFALTASCSLAIASPSFAARGDGTRGYTLGGTATLVQPGNASTTAVELTSTASTYGAVHVAVPPGLKLRQLTNLSTDSKFVVGSCWGGSPRFSVWITNGTSSGNIHFYVGPSGCSDAFTNSGNLATPTSTVDASQFGGSYYEPYSNVQADLGNYAVTTVQLVVDGGWLSNQTVDFDNTVVNQKLVTYED